MIISKALTKTSACLKKTSLKTPDIATEGQGGSLYSRDSKKPVVIKTEKTGTPSGEGITPVIQSRQKSQSITFGLILTPLVFLVGYITEQGPCTNYFGKSMASTL